VNLVTDTFPALALGMDPGDPAIMARAPRDPREGLFASGGLWRIAYGGAMIGALTLAAYFLGLGLYGGELAAAQTMALCVLSFSQLVHSFNLRHPTRSLLSVGPFKNRWLLGAAALGILLQTGVTLIPPLARAFKVVALDARGWPLVAALSVMPLLVEETRKLIVSGIQAGKRQR
jgi:P-type Ca2+ transporter type 2C